MPGPTYLAIPAVLAMLAPTGPLVAAATAQTLQAPSVGAMSAPQVGIEPAMKLSTAAYAREANALDAWVAAACRLATGRTRNAHVLAFARTAGPAHARALRERGGSPTRTPDLISRIGRLRHARADAFDRLFVAGQITAHRRLWSIHSGYAFDGADPRLRRTATAAVPGEERHLHALPMRPMPY